MNRVRTACFLVCLIFFVSGCAGFYTYRTAKAAPRGYKIEEGRKDGLVIVSFTHFGAQETWSFRDLKDGRVQHGVDVRKKPWGWGGPFDHEIYYDDAVIFALVVPEGEYEFYGWSTSYSYSTTPFSVQFKSISGKVVYVGNMCLGRQEGNRGFIRVIDNREKEIPIFKKYYPNIRDDQIEVQIMKQRAQTYPAPALKSD